MDENSLDPVLSLVHRLSEQNGDACYLVGGAIRDVLLGRPLKDLDFALLKDPKSVAEQTARALRGPFVSMTDRFEIYRTFLEDGTQLDFSRLKGRDIGEDLIHRDFSINAMAVQIRPGLKFSQIPNSLIDPHAGNKDLSEKVVRQISSQIYEEDPLRILRAFRIAAQIRFRIEPHTLESIQENAPKITQSAAERTREELLLILETPDSYETILQLDSCGLISILFPEVDSNRNCALDYYPGKGVWGHSLDALSQLEWIFRNLEKEFPEDQEKLKDLLHSRAALMKMSALFHDIGKSATAKVIDGRLRFYDHQMVGGRMAKEITKRLKFSANATNHVSAVIQAHMRPGGLAFAENLTEKATFRFFRDLEGAALPTLIVSLADRYTYLTPEERGQGKDVHEILVKNFIRWHYKKEIEHLSKKPKLLDGNTLMRELGLAPGPLIGQILKEVEEAVVLEEIHTPEEALELARKALSKINT
ncbi:MAG: HD domain-containing protein [Elusimicrobia bacterium]|nr:HD domain-containing protein [Elusimicrobiota bacterium]